jgi:4-hydroxy-3-polyprenylbenzoate decarboxylase
MAQESLGEFLSTLQDAGEIVRISAPVDSAVELAAIADSVVRDAPQGGPALLFTSVRNSQTPIIANLLGSPQRLCRALGVQTLSAAGQRLSATLQPDRPDNWWDALRLVPQLAERSSWMPKTVKQGLCQQVVKLGRDVNLYEWPTPKHWPQEANPVLTAGVLVTASMPEQPWQLSRHPVQVIDRQRLLPYWLPHQPILALAQRFRAERRQLPVALVFGGDPAFLIAAEAAAWSGLPPAFAWPGLLRGRACDLVKCRTHELEVPAEAEIVVEGFVDPDTDWETAPPVALPTGFLSESVHAPVIQVTAVTHRASPLLPTIVPGRPPHEEAWLRHAIDRLFLPAVQQLAPSVADCVRPWSGACRHAVFISIRKTFAHQARTVMHALWGAPAFQHAKTIVVVDEHVHVECEAEVWAAVSAHVDPQRDVLCLSGSADADDHAPSVRGAGGRWGIDATRKLAAEGAARPYPAALEFPPDLLHSLRVRWAELGLPAR